MNIRLHCLVLATILLTAASPSRADDRPVMTPARPSRSLRLDVRNIRDSRKGTTKVAITIAEKTVGLKTFESELSTLVRAAKAFGVVPRDVTFVMRVEKDVSVDALQQIINQAQENGFERFTIEAPKGTSTGKARSDDDKGNTKCHKRTRRVTVPHPRG